MEALWTVQLMLALDGLCLLFSPLDSICLELCDCQQHQPVLCTNRALRTLPKAIILPSPEDNLIYNLGGSFISNISAFDPPRFSLMQRADLQYNHILNIHTKAFQKLVRLVELCLGNNLLPGLAPRVLESLQKLRVLNLQWQRSEQVEPGLLLQSGQSSRAVLGPELSSGSTERARLPLKNVHLKNNHLHTLGRDAFSGLG